MVSIDRDRRSLYVGSQPLDGPQNRLAFFLRRGELTFCRRQESVNEYYWVLLTIDPLSQNRANCKIGRVAVELKGFGEVRPDQDRGRD